MRLTDMELGIIIGLLVMIITHAVISRYWLAGLIAGGICSLANAVHEACLNDFSIRPSDAALWIPMLLVMGFVMLTPPSFLVGLPFMLYRRRKKNVAEKVAASDH